MYMYITCHGTVAYRFRVRVMIACNLRVRLVNLNMYYRDMIHWHASVCTTQAGKFRHVS